MARILVVDDDRSIRRTLRIFLTDLGHDVLEAATGPEGQEAMVNEQPDLVLLDLNLPGKSGLDILEALHNTGKLPCTVIISARGDMRSTIQAIQHGAYDYLHKPLDIDKLRLTIDRGLHTIDMKRKLEQMVSEASSEVAMDQIIGESPAIREVFKTIAAATTTVATTLITGESGTGKELVARAIHYNSLQKSEPFVPVNCSAIPHNLLESELFGHIRGSYTGATENKEGRFSLARGGTLFLDEIGELSLEVQVKLLRVLQEKVFEKVGDSKPIPLEARIVAATNRNLPQLIRKGAFRRDLYYRLKVLEVNIPPLRQRKEDIPLLIDHLLSKICRELHKPEMYLDDEARELMLAYPWPGNVRELENALTRAVVLARANIIETTHLPIATSPNPQGRTWDASEEDELLGGPMLRGTTLRDAERFHVLRILARCNNNKKKAAELLGCSRPTVDKKIVDYAISDEEVMALVSVLKQGTI